MDFIVVFIEPLVVRRLSRLCPFEWPRISARPHFVSACLGIAMAVISEADPGFLEGVQGS